MTKQSMSSLEKMREIVIEEEKAMGIMEERKFIRPQMASRRYSIGRGVVMDLAEEAGALYKINRSCVINRKLFDENLEKYKVRSDKEEEHE